MSGSSLLSTLRAARVALLETALRLVLVALLLVALAVRLALGAGLGLARAGSRSFTT